MKRIEDLYSELKIPKNLQRHMLRVASIGKYTSQNWKENINEADVVETLLLHDLGNLLKFDFTKGVELLDKDERDADYWIQVQSELKSKYSSDEHTATQMMAKEAGVSERVLFLLNNMGSSILHKTLKIDDWELKICSYSDFRVSPYGFVTVEERFKDILNRYENIDHVLANKEKTVEKMNYCLELEKQLQPHVKVDLQLLPEKQLKKFSQEMKLWELSEA